MAWYDTVLKYVNTASDFYSKNKDTIDTVGKTVAASGKAYLDYKDQLRKNEIEEGVYDDYMQAAKDAGQEAQAAVDLNLTPMTVTGVPTSKADVTNFTALAANGGIIGLRNGTPNPGIAALRKKAPEVVKAMGFNMGGGPGIEALRKKAPGVVKRMGFEDGTGENGVQMIAEEISTNPLKQIVEKIKNTQYKRKLGRTDDGDLAERTSEYVDDNAFKENITAIREPGESENRAMLNAIINDGLDTEAKMDEASKEKIILSLLEEMRRSGDMEKKEYDLYMEAYSQSLNQGGIAGLRNGGRPGYMMGKGPVMDGTVSIKEAVSETEEPMKMAYSAGDPLMDVSKMNRIELVGNLNAMEFPELEASDYDDERIREMLIEFASDMFTDTRYAKGGRVKRAGGGVMDLGGKEKDYRFNGGFVPIGEYEKKDDVPARLSKNEFVFTADAVRAAGGGSINKGAQKMYNTMKTLEAQPQAKRMMT